MPITRTSEGLFLLPHCSGEAVKVGKAYLELPRFGGRSLLKTTLQMANLPDPEIRGNRVAVDNGKILFQQLATPVNRLFNEFGGIDQFIVLYSKPLSNELIFDYDTTELIPYFQPELTPQEIAEGDVRPAHVINSIAWYHPTKGGFVTPSDVANGYSTGKAFHQYRMKGNNKFWCNWKLLPHGQYSLVIPPMEWAKPGNYPMTIAPIGDTFGNTSVGATEATAYGTGYWRAVKATAPSSGEVTSIDIYQGSLLEYYKALLCDSSGNIVSNGTGTGRQGGTEDWRVLSFPTNPTITNATDYWIGVVGNGAGSSITFVYDTITADGKQGRDISNSYTTPTAPTDLDSNRTTKTSIRLVYTPGSSNTTCTPTTLAHTISTFAPTISVTDAKAYVPSNAALTIATFAPVIKLAIVVPVKALTISRIPPWINSPISSISNKAVDTEAGIYPAEISYQRKSFFGYGRYWVFYGDGYNVYFKSSVDNSTWTTATNLFAASTGNATSIWFDGTYVHYIRGSITVNVCYRRGLPATDGTITWGAEDDIESFGAIRNTICLDSDGYPCVTYTRYSTGRMYLSRSSTKDGTWTTDTGFPVEITSADEWTAHPAGEPQHTYPVTSPAFFQSCVVPLTSRKLYVVFYYELCSLYGKLYNAGFGSEEAVSSGQMGSESAVWSANSYGDTVYAALQEQDTRNILVATRTSSWGSPATAGTTETGSGNIRISPALSIIAGLPAVFWMSDLEDGWIMVSYYNGTSWASFNLFKHSDFGLWGWEINSFQTDAYGQLGVAYCGGNYDLYFGTVSFSQSFVPTTKSLTLTGYAPTVVNPVLVTVTTKALEITSFAAVIGTKIIVPTTALVLTKYSPVGSITCTPITAALVVTGYAPLQGEKITPTTLEHTLTGYAPTVTSAANIVVVPMATSLIITELFPPLRIKLFGATPTELVLATFAPTVTVAANQTVIPPIKTLTLTTYAPVLKMSVIAGLATLVVTKYIPSVGQISNNILVSTDLAALVLTTYAPVLVQTGNYVIIPTTQTLVITALLALVNSPGRAADLTVTVKPYWNMDIWTESYYELDIFIGDMP